MRTVRELVCTVKRHLAQPGRRGSDAANLTACSRLKPRQPICLPVTLVRRIPALEPTLSRVPYRPLLVDAGSSPGASSQTPVALNQSLMPQAIPRRVLAIALDPLQVERQ
jgi:hypothetical protein